MRRATAASLLSLSFTACAAPEESLGSAEYEDTVEPGGTEDPGIGAVELVLPQALVDRGGTVDDFEWRIEARKIGFLGTCAWNGPNRCYASSWVSKGTLPMVKTAIPVLAGTHTFAITTRRKGYGTERAELVVEKEVTITKGRTTRVGISYVSKEVTPEPDVGATDFGPPAPAKETYNLQVRGTGEAEYQSVPGVLPYVVTFGGKARAVPVLEQDALRSDWSASTAQRHPVVEATVRAGRAKAFALDVDAPNTFTVSVELDEVEAGFRNWGGGSLTVLSTASGCNGGSAAVTSLRDTKRPFATKTLRAIVDPKCSYEWLYTMSTANYRVFQSTAPLAAGDVFRLRRLELAQVKVTNASDGSVRKINGKAVVTRTNDSQVVTDAISSGYGFWLPAGTYQLDLSYNDYDGAKNTVHTVTF